MSAGSIIGAMGGEQSLEKMKGFKKAMPFTFRLLHHRRPCPVGHTPLLRLLLQGRDPARHRRAWRLALGAVRVRLHRRVHDRDLHLHMIFRAFYGDPVGAGQGARGWPSPTTRPRGRPTPPMVRSRTPTSASQAPPTRSPSGSCRCCVAMVILAIGAVGAGLVQIPNVDYVIDKFLRTELLTGPRCTQCTHVTACCGSAWLSAPCSA